MRADQIRVRLVEPPPGGDRRELFGIRATANAAGLQRLRVVARIDVVHVERVKPRPAEWLLHGVHQREKCWRREHPVPALDRALQDVRQSVHGLGGKQARRRGKKDCRKVDELAQPLPRAHQLQVLRRHIAAERNDRGLSLGQERREHAGSRVPAWSGVGLVRGQFAQRQAERRGLLPIAGRVERHERCRPRPGVGIAEDDVVDGRRAAAVGCHTADRGICRRPEGCGWPRLAPADREGGAAGRWMHRVRSGNRRRCGPRRRSSPC